MLLIEKAGSFLYSIHSPPHHLGGPSLTTRGSSPAPFPVHSTLTSGAPHPGTVTARPTGSQPLILHPLTHTPLPSFRKTVRASLPTRVHPAKLQFWWPIHLSHLPAPKFSLSPLLKMVFSSKSWWEPGTDWTKRTQISGKGKGGLGENEHASQHCQVIDPHKAQLCSQVLLKYSM